MTGLEIPSRNPKCSVLNSLVSVSWYPSQSCGELLEFRVRVRVHGKQHMGMIWREPLVPALRCAGSAVGKILRRARTRALDECFCLFLEYSLVRHPQLQLLEAAESEADVCRAFPSVLHFGHIFFLNSRIGDQVSCNEFPDEPSGSDRISHLQNEVPAAIQHITKRDQALDFRSVRSLGSTIHWSSGGN